MSKKDIAEVAAPTEGKGKTINIDGVEYNYSFTKLEKEEGILIQLSEVKPDKNITFSYQATSIKIAKDIKALLLCENIEEMINSLKDIFNLGEIKVEKKEEKYFMKIEVKTFGKLSKYEIELEKHESIPINQSNYLLNQLKDIDKKYKELKEEINNLKENNNINKKILNEEEKIKLIKEIKDNLNLSEKIKEVLQDNDIKNKLFQEFEEKISKIYIKKEKEENDKKDNNKLIIEKVEKSINKIINEKLSNKVDERVFNENIDKIKEDIEKQVNDIIEMKNNIVNKDLLKKN